MSDQVGQQCVENTWEKTNACEKNNVRAWWQQILPREGNKNKINNKNQVKRIVFPPLCNEYVKKVLKNVEKKT